MAKITGNIEVIQSYVLTAAKYDFSLYEKRILYQLVNLAQKDLEGKKLNRDYRITETLFKEKIVEMPIRAFLKDEKDQNYTKVKDALKSLRNKTVEYEDEDTWKLIGIIEKPRADKKRGMVEFEVMPEIWGAILNFTKGFNKFELSIAMALKSVYAMRFYELFANNLNPMTLTIDQLKERFQIVDKYSQTADFVKYVIIKSKTELDKVAPVAFNYKLNKKGRKVTSITFTPYEIMKNQTEELIKDKLEKSISLRWSLDKPVTDYLENLGFDEKGVRANLDDIKTVQSKGELMNMLADLKSKAKDKRSPKAYIMGAIKTRAEQLRKMK